MNNGYLLPYENDFSIKDLNLDLMKYVFFYLKGIIR